MIRGLIDSPRRQVAVAAPAIAAAAAVLWLFPPATFPVYPECPIHRLTGLACPGCGATRALACLIAGDWSGALAFNPLAVGIAPLALAFSVQQAVSAVRWNRWRVVAVPRQMAAAGLTALVLFGLARNIF